MSSISLDSRFSYGALKYRFHCLATGHLHNMSNPHVTNDVHERVIYHLSNTWVT